MSALTSEGLIKRYRNGRHELIAHEAQMQLLVDAGLAESSTWQALLRSTQHPGHSTPARGRGHSTRWTLPSGTGLVLKQVRRGGVFSHRVWNDRFPGTRRLVANFEVPLEAARRGVATPAPIALLLKRGPCALYEAWLGVEEIPGALALKSRLAEQPVPDHRELGAAIAQIRLMHDVGVDHRDLNLGNVLVRRTPAGRYEGFLVDLDYARLGAGPVPFRVRRAALRRLARSYSKCFGPNGPLGGDGTEGIWHELYAGRDEVLADRLRAGRRTDRVLLRMRQQCRRLIRPLLARDTHHLAP